MNLSKKVKSKINQKTRIAVYIVANFTRGYFWYHRAPKSYSSLSMHYVMANFLSDIVSDLSKLILYLVSKIAISNQKQFLFGKQDVHLPWKYTFYRRISPFWRQTHEDFQAVYPNIWVTFPFHPKQGRTTSDLYPKLQELVANQFFPKRSFPRT